MKIGDLVELSSQARKLKYNKSLVGKMGIVTEKANPSSILFTGSTVSEDFQTEQT